jgi:hypothetical protein
VALEELEEPPEVLVRDFLYLSQNPVQQDFQ